MNREPHRRGESPRPSSEQTRLAELRGREERLEALRERRTDLEVDRIVAEMALRGARKEAHPNVSGPQAAAIVDALDRLRRIESERAARLAFAEAGVRSNDELLDRLRAGDDALGAWMAADREDAGASSGRRIARQALLGACLVVLALAFMVHLAFLVLLVPAGGAMSFLLWTGQDRAWRRMGARRRYDALRLEAPAAWTEDAVRERRHALSVLAERLRERTSDPEDEDGEAEEGDLSAEIDATGAELRKALAAAGLAGDAPDEPTEATMRALARAWRTGQTLRRVVEDMAGERAGAGEIRESIYRDLAREGEAAPDGDASVGVLEAGVERIGRR